MKCAIIYDFDGTLAKGNCMEHGLLKELGILNNEDFWKETKEIAKTHDGDEILAYLGVLVKYASKNNSNILEENILKNHGKNIPLFPGVESWFERINVFASEIALELNHYIVSSGLDALIQGTPIAVYFKKIYACKYQYNESKSNVLWPALAINYTTKTQYLFRINKGIDNSWDNEAINRFIEPRERDISFENMVYIGDGDTDIPAMKMTRIQGGHSLAVFDKDKWNDSVTQDKIAKLIAEERANYVVPADYNNGSQLDITVKGILQLIKRKNK